MTQINIQAEEETRLKVLARRLVASMTAFYEDPENLRKFEEWKKQRDMQKKGERE